MSKIFLVCRNGDVTKTLLESFGHTVVGHYTNATPTETDLQHLWLTDPSDVILTIINTDSTLEDWVTIKRNTGVPVLVCGSGPNFDNLLAKLSVVPTGVADSNAGFQNNLDFPTAHPSVPTTGLLDVGAGFYLLPQGTTLAPSSVLTATWSNPSPVWIAGLVHQKGFTLLDGTESQASVAYFPQSPNVTATNNKTTAKNWLSATLAWLTSTSPVTAPGSSGKKILLVSHSITNHGYLLGKQMLENLGHEVVGCIDTVPAMQAAWDIGDYNLIATTHCRSGASEEGNSGSGGYLQRDFWLRERWRDGAPLILGPGQYPYQGSTGGSAFYIPYNLGIAQPGGQWSVYGTNKIVTTLDHPTVPVQHRTGAILTFALTAPGALSIGTNAFSWAGVPFPAYSGGASTEGTYFGQALEAGVAPNETTNGSTTSPRLLDAELTPARSVCSAFLGMASYTGSPRVTAAVTPTQVAYDFLEAQVNWVMSPDPINPSVSSPWSYWDGTSEILLPSVSYWDGTNEIALPTSEIAP